MATRMLKVKLEENNLGSEEEELEQNQNQEEIYNENDHCQDQVSKPKKIKL